MIRHISIFTFKDHSENGKTKAENIAVVRAYLEHLPELYPGMTACQVGAALPGEAPDVPGGPIFGDLAFIADYETEADAAGFPPSKAHLDLVALSEPMMEKVTAIDFAC